MSEKRNYQRIEGSLAGQYKISSVSGDFYETTAVNLSPEGVCFYSNVKIEQDQDIDLRIQLTQEKSVQIKGHVAWSDKKDESGFYRVGLTMTKAGTEDESILFAFYHERVASEQRPKKKVLVVDDEKDLAQLLSFHLVKAGYDVLIANDGEEGYQRYEQERPDLIVLDLKMPKLNGFEVCRKIRREKKDTQIPIIMLTALQDDADRLIGKVVGAQRYMTKPFKMEDLLQEVEWLMPNDAVWGSE